MALVDHGRLARRQVGEGIQIAVAQPAGGQDRVVQLLVEIQDLDHLLLGKGGPPRLGVEEPSPVGLGQLRHQDVDEEPDAREGQAVAGHPAAGVSLHHGLRHLDEFVPGLGRLQPLRLEDILAVDEQVRIGGVGHAVVLPVEPAQVARDLEDVVLPDGVGDVLLVPQEPLVIEGGAGEGLPVTRLRRRARGQGRRQLRLQVTPGQAFLPDVDVRMQFFEFVGDLLHRRDRLGFGLRVPDAHHLLLAGPCDTHGQRQQADCRDRCPSHSSGPSGLMVQSSLARRSGRSASY